MDRQLEQIGKRATDLRATLDKLRAAAKAPAADSA
jgi:hypothetical protein